MPKIKKYVSGLLARRGLRLSPIDFHVLKPVKFFADIYREEFEDSASGFLNIGAGRFRHPRWINLDLRDEYVGRGWLGNDINYDLLSFEPIPVDDGALHCVYSSHVVEHLSDDAVVYLFAQIRRMLRPGGGVRIVCPDIDLAIGAFRRNDHWFFTQIFGEHIADVGVGLVRYCATQLVDAEFPGNRLGSDFSGRLSAAEDIYAELDALCKQCDLDWQRQHPNDHINYFNEARLIGLLHDAGFVDAQGSRAGQSSIAILRETSIFDTTLPYMSLYVEAYAPRD